MKQLINRPTEEKHDNPNRDVTEFTQLAIPYILQLFHAGLEGRHGVRISIQCADSGAFRGTITAEQNLGKSTESGVVAFTNAESVGGVLAYFEDALTYGELSWKPDKFWSKAKEEATKTPAKRKKIPLRL